MIYQLTIRPPLVRLCMLLCTFLAVNATATWGNSSGAYVRRWDLTFELPESLPYSRIKVPFELTFFRGGRVSALSMGTPGISMSEGRIDNGRLSMRGTSALGPFTLSATISGGKIKGVWTVSAFQGRVEGVRISSNSTKASRLAVFDNVWSIIDKEFYSPDFNGVDWKFLRSRYRPRASTASTDGQLVMVVRELLSELESSHLGFYALSPDEALVGRSSTASRAEKSRPITWRMLSPDIGYLRVHRFEEGTGVLGLVDQAFSFIGRAPSLIIDLRGNQGGTLSAAMRIGDFIFPEPRLLGILATRNGLRYYKAESINKLNIAEVPVYHGYRADEFLRTLRVKGAVALRFGGLKKLPQERRLVMLMDEKCASTAEGLLAMAKEAGVATLIGRRSAGALLSAVEVEVVGGWRLRFPEADFRTLSGRRVEGQGVEPDIIIEARRGEEDDELRLAIQYLKNQLSGV